MNYKNIELWKNRGFIGDNLTPEKQLELTNNLTLGKNLLNCFLVLNNYNQKFYDDVESVLYPIIVFYTKKHNQLLGKPIIHNFIRFCENNINIKYNLSEYNQDYLLCEDFISQN